MQARAALWIALVLTHDVAPTSTADGPVRVARVRLPIPAEALHFWINSVNFSPDGKNMVIAASDWSVRIVNVRAHH